MSSNKPEVLDANIVLLLEEPLRQNVPLTMFEEGKLASLMRKPTVNQGLTVDSTTGTAQNMFQIESMRSQKTINISQLRIEVHDLSGEEDPESTHLPEIIVALVNALHIESAKAIGANWVISFELPKETSAAEVIAEKLLQKNFNFLPEHLTPIGGIARLFLSDAFGTMYTLALEPRGQDVKTNTLWMSCNVNGSSPEDLSLERFTDTFRRSYELLFQVKESLFPAS
ncbi:MAG TPA: hypothetical protein VKT25_05270 [Ktedonobacteraceae bacterium]|nr:hypothetical protein [Ktedonobacteraceae bacterium]